MNRYSKEEINDLIKSIGKGDKEALDVLFRSFSKAVYFFVLPIIKTKELAEDVVQETFIKIIQKADTFRVFINGDAWIYKIAKNIALSMLRKNKAKETFFLDDYQDQNKSESIENVAIGNIHRQRFLDLLTLEEQRIIVLKEYYNYTLEQISKIIGKSLITIKRRMANIKEKYKKYVEID